MKKELVSFVVCCALFVLFAFGITAFYNKEFLAWASEISLFLPTRMFLLQNMQTAGGLLSYGGAFFTQFFYYPLLGSLMLIVLLSLVTFLVIKAFRFSGQTVYLSFIPALALLLSVTEVEYVLYSLKTPGYLFSNTLGIIVCLSSLWGYRNVQKDLMRMSLLPLFIILTYPLFGFYTLFAAVLCVLTDLIEKRPQKLLKILITILLIGIVPYLYSRFIYTQMPWSETYTAGLPHFFFTRVELPLWIPFIVLFLSLLIFSVNLRIQQKRSKMKMIVSICVFLISIYGVYALSYRNSNFKTELQMLQAIETDDWNRVVSIGEQQRGQPTRLIVMCWNLALYKLGQAGDRMFEMDNNSVMPQTRRQRMVMMHAGAKPVYYQYGKINYCYRWCMEDLVEYGMTVQDLKYMVKCALMNGELALASKCNNILKQTLFHKQWAKRYQQYIDNPEMIKEDAEMKAICPLTAYQNLLDGDNNMLELYILNSFAFMEGGTPEVVEMSLICNMILKNIERFWPRFFLYARTHNRIPVCYQEAAVLYAYLEGEVDAGSLPLDDAVIDNFNNLIWLSKKNTDMSDEYNRKAFKPQFGKTFWYYYFFIIDNKMN
ncbi:MAG: DUF6057 family protein [Dysgonamonadaceae bacterium]|jgi:hypothetical protein|nr:DUF6057 family protein [Dysgonamonadaceae bacterium]